MLIDYMYDIISYVYRPEGKKVEWLGNIFKSSLLYRYEGKKGDYSPFAYLLFLRLFLTCFLFRFKAILACFEIGLWTNGVEPPKELGRLQESTGGDIT